ncbi:MAG: DnaJ family domain-containing protein [Phycisphaerae bacterium]|nr:DnaJ family domain-containing protein [Tepidisphaeraceae bacterium]
MSSQDIGGALRRLAEHRIEQAMREGKFDNLSGAGQPVDLDSMPVDENARMIWWALKIMRQDDPPPRPERDVVPPRPVPQRAAARDPFQCGDVLCGTRNHPGARFCRRCGRPVL